MSERNSENMMRFTISEDYLKLERSSSYGNQIKYYKDGVYYKLNSMGYESTAEILVSLVLKHSNVSDYVTYYPCEVNGRKACMANDFLEEDESFFTFDHIYKKYRFSSLSDEIMRFATAEERIDFTTVFFKNVLKVDCRAYLSVNIALDMLVLNNDRHFNNLGFVYNVKENIYRCAPVFDNGAALLSNFSLFPPYDEIEDMVERVTAKPFSGSFGNQFMAIENLLKIDYAGLLNELETQPESRAKQVLLYQLNRYRDIFDKNPSV